MIDEKLKTSLYRLQGQLTLVTSEKFSPYVDNQRKVFYKESIKKFMPSGYSTLYSSMYTIKFDSTDIFVHGHYIIGILEKGNISSSILSSELLCKLKIDNDDIELNAGKLEISEEMKFYFEFINLDTLMNSIKEIKEQVKYYEYTRFGL